MKGLIFMTIEEAYLMLQKIECRSKAMPDIICFDYDYQTPTTMLEGLDQNDVWQCATFLLDFLDEHIVKEEERMTYQRYRALKGD